MTPAVVEIVARLVSLLLDMLERWDRDRAQAQRQRIRDAIDNDPAGAFAAHFGVPANVPTNAAETGKADAGGNADR